MTTEKKLEYYISRILVSSRVWRWGTRYSAESLVQAQRQKQTFYYLVRTEEPHTLPGSTQPLKWKAVLHGTAGNQEIRTLY